MTVSHELRTPLTAIRGHVSALAEGLVDDQAVSLAIVTAETERLERLVGDILDLARLDAHRFTVLREEVGMEHLVRARLPGTFAEQGTRAVDRLQRDGERAARDRLRRRPRPPDRRQSPRECVPGDTRRRGGSASSSARRTAPMWVAVEDTGPGIAPEEFAHARFGRSSFAVPARRHRSRPGRSRASCRSPRARRRDRPRLRGRAGIALRADLAAVGLPNRSAGRRGGSAGRRLPAGSTTRGSIACSIRSRPPSLIAPFQLAVIRSTRSARAVDAEGRSTRRSSSERARAAGSSGSRGP